MQVKTLQDMNKLPKSDDIPIIYDTVITRFKTNPEPFTLEEIQNVQKEKIIEFLLSKINTGTDKTLKLVNPESDHVDWLSKQDKSKWFFSKRFEDYLSEDTEFGPAATRDIFDDADQILSRLENPKRPGPWRNQGLVFGNVQSGKTSNYSALINKAADAGYKYIIVLGGLNKNLRSQTQISLEKNFTGYQTDESEDSKGNIGVGNYPNLSNEDLNVNVFTTRGDKGDFKKSDIKKLKTYNPDTRNPNLFVIKKNGGPLKHVLQALINKIDNENGIEEPLLLIDDECDNGSVNTKQKDKDPTRFNAYIRAILSLFSKAAYVAYTATPFANIFIDPEKSKFQIQFDGDVLKDEDGHSVWEVKNNVQKKKIEKIVREVEDSDLYPHDFIVNLKENNQYVGAKKLFNIPDDLDESKEISPLPLVKPIERILKYDDEKIKLETAWIPLRHKKDYRFKYDGDENDMSPSLEYAMKCFLLSIAGRNCRFDQHQHNTMLINITNWVPNQQQIVDLVTKKLDQITNGIKGNFADIIEDLKIIWETDFKKTTSELNQMISNNDIILNNGKIFSEISWEKILEQLQSPKIVKEIQIHKVYGTNKDVLLYDYFEDTGLNVIAVGAIKLSRGLVLKNLSVSYFKRPAKQYDTLLQMGRWFGYRPKYLDLCRLFIDNILLDRFEKASWESEKLKADFKLMNDNYGTPKEWGFKVRTYAENDQLTPTSKNKMLSAIRRNITFDGKRAETTRWFIDKENIKKNINNFKNLLNKIKNSEIKSKPNMDDSFHIWRDIDLKVVRDFLSNYKSPLNLENNARINEIIEYLDRCKSKGKVNKWDIFVKGKKSGKEIKINNLNFNLLKRTAFSGRSRSVLREDLHYKKEISNGKTKIIYLEKGFAKTEDALNKYYYLGGVADKDLSTVMGDHEIQNIENMSEFEIRKKMLGHKGYLGFYLFDPKGSKSDVINNFYKDIEAPLIGFSLSFPENPSLSFNYMITKQKYINDSFEDDYEDDYDDDQEGEE